MNHFELFVMWLLPKHKRYTYAMLKAIDKARSPVWIGEKYESMTYGLRVIKRFEDVNKCKFNPLDDLHVELVTGNAGHESFLRRMSINFKDT